MSSSSLTSTQKYAAGALFGLALHQAQIQQTRQLGIPSDDDIPDRVSSGSSSDSVSEDPELWINEFSDLLRPIFRFHITFFLVNFNFNFNFFFFRVYSKPKENGTITFRANAILFYEILVVIFFHLWGIVVGCS